VSTQLVVSVALAVVASSASCGRGEEGAPRAPKRIVILMIGDGMGAGHLEAASLRRHGAPGRLAMQRLPVRTTVVTGSLSGTTDSAAAATALSTGTIGRNGRIAVDAHGARLDTAAELAHRFGLRAGIVATSSVVDATPAAFSSHGDARQHFLELARDQVLRVRPEVMLGGGARWFASLTDELAGAGYTVIRDSNALATARGAHIVGLFAPDALPYATARQPGAAPSLAELTRDALARLDDGSRGFFLLVEGSLIDDASHDNSLEHVVGEVLAFDDAVEAAAAWAAGRDDVTLIATADHECGGLTVINGHGAGVLPDVRWASRVHTNARVALFASGPGTDTLRDADIDHRTVHAVLRARLTGVAPTSPAPVLVPDGRLDDLAHRIPVRVDHDGDGPSQTSRLTSVAVGGDASVLGLGIEARLGAGATAVVLLDVDFGATTGVARFTGALRDRNGSASALLSALSLAIDAAGFGADLAIVASPSATPTIEELSPITGLRGLRPPYGDPARLQWLPVASNLGDELAPGAPRVLEVHLPWTTVFAGAAPGTATLAAAVLIVDKDGLVLDALAATGAPRSVGVLMFEIPRGGTIKNVRVLPARDSTDQRPGRR
jgi:alkaline phosphatase